MHQDHNLLMLKVPILPIPTLAKLDKLESNIRAGRHVAGVMNGDIEDGLSWPSYTWFLFQTLFKLAESGSDLWFDSRGERSPLGDDNFARTVVVSFPPKISRVLNLRGGDLRLSKSRAPDLKP